MKYLIYLLTIVIGIPVFAQRGNVAISYPISFPMGDQKDYIDKTSFRGISLEFITRVKQQVAVGLEIGWTIFYERKDDQEYKQNTASISGIQYRYTNTMPIIAGAKYFKVTAGSPVAPFLGVGLGTLYVNRSTDFGLYRITNEAWQFCIRPEVGVLFKLAPGVNALAGAKYYAAFKASDLDGQSLLSANVGFLFSSPMR